MNLTKAQKFERAQDIQKYKVGQYGYSVALVEKSKKVDQERNYCMQSCTFGKSFYTNEKQQDQPVVGESYMRCIYANENSGEVYK